MTPTPRGEPPSGSQGPAISATGIDKSFGRTVAVDGATITVEQGQLVALLGPSGSGKTTLLRVIAGFEVPDAGTVTIGGRTVVGDGLWEEPERRRVGMVFQDGALFPHLTVGRNVAFGEPAAGRVEECLELVGLADRADSYPHELSGGEAQRVALARALANEPAVVLLDEPFASLDATLRVELREEVASILRQTGASALLVTHDQQEALSLADQIVVMCDGRVAQAGPPEEVYANPSSRWVAEFLGAAEVLPGTARDGQVDCALGRFPAAADLAGGVEVVVRPEAVRLWAAADGSAVAPAAVDDASAPVAARVTGHSFFGHDQVVHLELADGVRVRSRVNGASRWHSGDEVLVSVAGSVTVLPLTTATG